MKQTLNVGVIGDYDPGVASLVATETALDHAAAALAVPLSVSWISTPSLAGADVDNRLVSFHGLWCAPGSPYQSMRGALQGIRFAREQKWPFIGT
jgi:CTP synthase (UTP-ammonia lyase)